MNNLEKVSLSGIWDSDLKIERSQNINIIHDIYNNQIVIEKIERRCFLCHSDKKIQRIRERFICEKCIKEIKATL